MATWSISAKPPPLGSTPPSLMMRTPHAPLFSGCAIRPRPAHLAGSHLSHGALPPRAPSKPATPNKSTKRKSDPPPCVSRDRVSQCPAARGAPSSPRRCRCASRASACASMTPGGRARRCQAGRARWAPSRPGRRRRWRCCCWRRAARRPRRTVLTPDRARRVEEETWLFL